jgi:DNA-binding CsgD family transcriptional regulator
MSLFGFTMALAVISFLFNSIYTFYININSKANRIFSFSSFVIFLWYTSYLLFSPSEIRNSPVAFHQFFVYLYYFISAVTLHFSISLTKNNYLNRKWFLILLYLPSFYFIFRGISVLSSSNSRQLLNSTWIEEGTSRLPVFQIYCAICLLLLAIHIFNFFIWAKKSSSNRVKKQAGMFIAGFLTCYTLIGVINLCTRIFENGIFPVINTIIMFTVTWIFTAITVKYKFMTAVPSIFSDEILNNIHEIVAILDIDLKIININNKFRESLQVETESADKKAFPDFIENAEEFKKNIKNIIGRKKERIHFKIYYKKDSGSILTDSSVSGVVDKYSDLIGILIISNENKGREQMLIAYRLTDREFEIIELSVHGLSSKEIGDKLNISARTVETHLKNVYNKMGIENKIELLNIAYSFNLIRKDYPVSNGLLFTQ